MSRLGISVAPFGYAPRDQLTDFLRERHAETIGHSGRTFLDHLQGTEKLLREWGMPAYVCDAGLFHSVYGTNIFTLQSVSFDERDVVELLIGKKAEWLAYLFCVAKRPQAFFAAFDDNWIANRHAYHGHMVTNEEIQELIAIEVANHIEQDMGAELVAKVWDRGLYNHALTKKAMDDMRRFMHKHGINR